MLLTELVVALILGGIRPGLYSVAMLLVLFPVTDVLGAIHVLVSTPTMGLVIEPVTIVTVTVSMDQSSISVCLVVLPVAFVLATVLPDLDSLAISEAFLGPLTMIDCSIIKFVWPSAYNIFLSRTFYLIENEWTKSLFCFSGGSV